MAHAAGDAHEYPVYGYHFRMSYPVLDNTGALLTGGLTGLDSKYSMDAGTYRD